MSIQHKDITGADSIHPIMYVQTSDPGAVGANKWWLDTTAGTTLEAGAILKQRNETNTGWTTRADVKTALDLKATLTSVRDVALPIVIGNGSDVITTGVKGFIEIPFACTIVAHRLVANASGSIVIDLWKDTYANFPPLVADTITAAAKPTLAAAQKAEDTTLTGWTTSITAGNWLAINVDSATTVTQVTLSLTLRRS